MNTPIIGYRYHWDSKTYSPVYERPKGTVATAAMMICDECRIAISPMGGGGRYLCPECYENFKLVNFTEGNDPV